jgi:hypothetical protein
MHPAKLALAIALILILASVASADDKVIRFSLSIAYVGLAVTDTALTIYGTSHLGLIEKNRLFAPMFAKHQYAKIWALEVIQSVAIVGLCNWLISSDEDVPRIIGYTFLVASVVFRGYVVMKNLRLHSRVN